jgi:membrane associated rhomboid family serine protease
MEASAPEKTTCYRHRGRETGVACSSCGRPICPDCMTPTPVGMRCPDCARQKTRVRTATSLQAVPYVTYALIAINVIAYVLQIVTGTSVNGRAGGIYEHGALYGPLVADGEWWRIFTAGFLHASPLHILFNMYILWYLGTLLEPAIGRLRFALLYVVSLVGGSLGALIVSPDAVTVGASGAVFGLMGAGFLVMRARGIDPLQSGLGVTLALNLGITFLIPNISIGGHIGGLLAGGVAGYLMFEVCERRQVADGVVLLGSVALAAGLAIAAVLVA